MANASLVVLRTKRVGEHEILVKVRDQGSTRWLRMDLAAYLQSVTYQGKDTMRTYTKPRSSERPEIRRIRRGIELNENFREAQNLTPSQTAWEDSFKRLRKHIVPGQSREPLHASILAFMPYSDKYEVPVLSDEVRIVPARNMRLRVLVPVPTENWTGRDRRSTRYTYRLHYCETGFEFRDGGLVADMAAAANSHFKVDAANAPLQDHPLFNIREYNPNHGVGGEPLLKTPIGGIFKMQVNDRHLTLRVDGHPVFRMESQYGESLETHSQDAILAEDGSKVHQGDSLVRMTKQTYYGELRWIDVKRKQPELDSIAGDLMPARRARSLLLMAQQMDMLANTQLPEDDPGYPASSNLEQCFPSHFLEFSEETFQDLTWKDWTTPTVVKRHLAQQLGPEGSFRVLLPDSDALIGKKWKLADITSGDDEDTQKYIFMDEVEADLQEVVLLKSAMALEAVAAGALVEIGDPVADWCPRRVFDSWESVQESVSRPMTLIREYLNQSAIRGGYKGYTGDGVLLDARIVPSEYHGEASDHYLSFLDVVGVSDEGWLIASPIYSEGTCSFSLGGIAYDWAPQGVEARNPLVC